MGRFTSKEDDVAKISTSIFVTNFPEGCSAKELFIACKQYGHVVDAFIPFKRSKAGKRFGFVRFINVFNEERLVNNLCTVWIDRFKLQANIAKFHRSPANGNNYHAKKDVGTAKSNSYVSKKDSGNSGVGNTYAHVLKGISQNGIKDNEPTPAIVLDDDCLNSKDMSLSLLGRVKEFASLSNLKSALINEGFVDITIRYMGELWVSLEFTSDNSKKLFQENVGVRSWFSKLTQASNEFNTEGRIVWVEIEGIPFKLWSGNTFKRIASKWGELLDTDQEDKCFHSKRLCILTRLHNNIFESFKIIFRGKVYWIRPKEAPGWVPDFLEEYDEEDLSVDGSKDDDPKIQDLESCGGDSDSEVIPDTIFEEKTENNHNGDEGSSGLKENHSEDPFGIYSLLNKKKDMSELNNNLEQSLKYPPGFTPDEKKSDMLDVNKEDNRSNNGPTGDCIGTNSKIDITESGCSGHFKQSEAPRSGENHSEDPFGIYSLLNKKKDMSELNNNLEQSLKYPPGFTPDEKKSDMLDVNKEDNRSNNGPTGDCIGTNSKIDITESGCSGHFKQSEAPRSGVGDIAFIYS
ncbi:hypothetical protein CTI12_AA253200 [Artemisia annua]|uniref:RRM domain-containing protein n=1 Tax=Artemisia annua TaxID=35608 RepID=A0A2U1NL44_ARTAN|nr:hypothetical protein CTI12_AA253200 [Artemisia annua]